MCAHVPSCFSCVQLFETLWTIACLPGSSVHGILQARALEWVAMPSSRDLPNPGIKLTSLMPPALAGGFSIDSTTWETPSILYMASLPNVCQSQPPIHPTPPLGIQMFFLYLSVSVSAWQIRSSVPFSKILNIYMDIGYMFFYFWLTSLSIEGF